MSGRYYGLSAYFMKVYGEKLVKLSLDGGFTCPNRDGTLSSDGCIFCSESGSGEFAGTRLHGIKNEAASIREQVESQKRLMSEKWASKAYIAYFQNYTNTYKSIEALDSLYRAALDNEGVKGIAIATRPDCVKTEHIELFKRSNVIWIELGLQTIHDERAGWLRRHYDFNDFKAALQLLQSADIPVVVHLIAGLPGETKDDFLESVKALSAFNLFGVKFHMLNILKGTQLETLFDKSPFHLLSESEYIEWICEAIEHLNPETVIHRLTGDGERSMLVAPRWVLNKRSVINGINKSLVARNSVQGQFYNHKG